MSKGSLKSRILQLRISTCTFGTICLITVITLFTSYGEYNYPHISESHILMALHKGVNPTLVLKKTQPDCKYEDILKSTNTWNSWDVNAKDEDFVANGIANGSFVPEHCNPLFSVAILVTYRNRQSQLETSIPYLHNFLRKQNLHYKLYLIEQQDEKPWNKGLLYNIGAKHAMLDKFPCLILQDVDLLPLDESNLYACMSEPRHMSASIDKFRYVLPYDSLVGGVLAIKADQYTMVNGFSNRFTGWGGEDDEFAQRLAKHHLNVLRFPRHMSRYTMLSHPQEHKNTQREHLLVENRLLEEKDGLNSMHYESATLKNHRLFTMIGVKT